jgi:hypothetical protein
MPTDRWSDDRLDEMNRRLINVENVDRQVAVIQTEQASMKLGLSRVEDGLGKLTDKLGQVVDEPLVRARDFRQQVKQGVIAAVAGGTIVFLATLIAGALK